MEKLVLVVVAAVTALLAAVSASIPSLAQQNEVAIDSGLTVEGEPGTVVEELPIPNVEGDSTTLSSTVAFDGAEDGRSVSATGVLEKPGMTTYMYGTHAIEDEATGVGYALSSESVDLDAYVGERVTVRGDPVSGYENGQVEGGPTLLEVRSAEPTPTDSEATVAFEEASNGEDVNEDGVVDEADDELAARVSDDARSSADPDRNFLPITGGAAFLVLLAGSGLAAAGYAAYRAVR